MTKEQLIQIAKSGFPDIVKENINFDELEMHFTGDIYRLYPKDEIFNFIPSRWYIAVHFEPMNFVQIHSKHYSFNHFAAIEKMKELSLI